MEDIKELRLAELAELANVQHREIVGTLRESLSQAIRAGEMLAEAKALCPHRTWLRWLEANFEGSVRTAQEYMRLYNNADEIRAKARGSAPLSIGAALRELVSSPRSEPARVEITYESKDAEPAQPAGPTEYTLERAVQPSPEPHPTIRMPLHRYRTAEHEDGPQHSHQQSEAIEETDDWQPLDHLVRVSDFVENGLFDHSDEVLIAWLEYLRHLLNELDLPSPTSESHA